MFTRFNLELNEELEVDVEKFKQENLKIKKDVEEVLNKYINNDGSIDGDGLREEWFPKIDVDVFISHSHNDEDTAIKLGAWLYKNFGLKSFIDSFVWGSADKLLSTIDKKYCMNKPGSYDYEKRNFSTSHIHMMLSIALGMIMQKAETVIFLNTSESISAEDTINKTNSPWIYYEIFSANIIEKMIPKRYEQEIKSINEHYEFSQKKEKLSIKYELDLSKFIKINNSDLKIWKSQYVPKEHPLDILYKNKGIIKIKEEALYESKS